MALFEDDKPKRKISHDIGQDLYLLSVAELDERVGILKNEIARLEADRAAKTSSKSAAEALFR